MTATFTTEGHIYQADGVLLPSVSQVLELSGIDDVSMIPLHYLDRAAAIGTAVHEACHFLDEDDLDLESVAPEIVGYVLAYQKFKQETGFVPIKIEERGIAEGTLKYGYCVDRVGMLDSILILIDIKTGSRPRPAWQIQTAGYADGLRHEGPRAAVHVTKDGKYKLIPHEDERDFETWRGALQIAWWKLEHGAKL